MTFRQLWLASEHLVEIVLTCVDVINVIPSLLRPTGKVQHIERRELAQDHI